jgi:hypothetical protein
MKRALALGVAALLLTMAMPAIAQAQGGGTAPAAQAPPPPPPPTVKVGEPMPDFDLAYLETVDGKPSRKNAKLSDYKGKQVVVLAFFPAAFSPG